MATTIIAINDTTSELFINDLGIGIPASSQIELTELFTKIDISTSTDIDTYVLGGLLTINDGTNDLSIVNGIRHVNFETEYEDVDGVFIDHELDEHTDVPTKPTSGHKTLECQDGNLHWIISPVFHGGGDTIIDMGAADRDHNTYRTTTWISVRQFIYRGSSIVGVPTGCKYLVKAAIGLIAYYQLYDTTHDTVISEVSTSSSDWVVLADDTMTNVPPAEAIFDVRVKGSIRTKDIYISSFLMQFYL